MECFVPISRALLKPEQALLELHHTLPCDAVLHLKPKCHFDMNFLFYLVLQERGLNVELQNVPVLFYDDCYKQALSADATNWCKFLSTIYSGPLVPSLNYKASLKIVAGLNLVYPARTKRLKRRGDAKNGF